MAGKEFELPELGMIYNRLKRAERISLASNLLPEAQAVEILENPDSAALVDRALHLDSGPFTNAARSEIAIGEREIASLEQRIDKVRDLLFAQGKPFTESPDYQEWIENNWRTPEECKDIFFHGTDLFSIQADRNKPISTTDDGDKLWLSRCDRKRDIHIRFSFNDDFKLQIQFQDPEQPRFVDVQYNTLERPLTEMTPEEYAIVAYCLDEYIEQETSGSQA